MSHRILAVIPARGGSKGIPRKNIRLMNGRPLIAYSILNALQSKYIGDVVVTSDDEEILDIAGDMGVYTLDRKSELAKDATTLDPVVYDACIRMEESRQVSYDIVITLQATSPLLSVEVLDRAIEAFLQTSVDTMISVVNKPHLAWTKQEGKIVPCYTERKNRQELPPNYLETGAFFISRRACVSMHSRIGFNVSVYEVPERESTDIDTASDWAICEHELKKKRIVFRADGYKELGMGHIFHCLTLAYNLTGHDIMFVTKRQHLEGLKKLQDSHMPLTLIENEVEFFDFLKEWQPDIVVHDCLDTEKDYMCELKKVVPKVVTIEDVGEGSQYADVVINALYEDLTRNNNYYWGENYVCLRDEFFLAKPKPFREKVENVLVMFGGTDPSNFTKRIYELAKRLHSHYPYIQFTFLMGSGYDAIANGIEALETYNIKIARDKKRVSTYMREADLAFTSQGRTVYELAALGVPAIVLAQNEREMRHTFAQMQNGFINLGYGQEVEDTTIENTFCWLCDTEGIRREMRELMLGHDLKRGTKRVIDLILKEE